MMFLSHARWIVLVFVQLRLSVVALFQNYGKMPSARALGLHVTMFTCLKFKIHFFQIIQKMQINL